MNIQDDYLGRADDVPSQSESGENRDGPREGTYLLSGPKKKKAPTWWQRQSKCRIFVYATTIVLVVTVVAAVLTYAVILPDFVDPPPSDPNTPVVQSPDAPTLLAANYTSLSFMWELPASVLPDLLLNFLVQQSDQGYATFTTVYNGTGTNLTVSGLLPAHDYFYQVRVYTVDGLLSNYSDVATFTTLTPGVASAPPAVFPVSTNQTEITFAWLPPTADNGDLITAYESNVTCLGDPRAQCNGQCQYGECCCQWYLQEQGECLAPSKCTDFLHHGVCAESPRIELNFTGTTPTFPNTEMTFVVDGLVADCSCEVSVRANNSVGWSEWSPPVLLLTDSANATVPSAPPAPTASQVNMTSMVVTAPPPSTDGGAMVTEYRIYMALVVTATPNTTNTGTVSPTPSPPPLIPPPTATPSPSHGGGGGNSSHPTATPTVTPTTGTNTTNTSTTTLYTSSSSRSSSSPASSSTSSSSTTSTTTPSSSSPSSPSTTTTTTTTTTSSSYNYTLVYDGYLSTAFFGGLVPDTTYSLFVVCFNHVGWSANGTAVNVTTPSVQVPATPAPPTFVSASPESIAVQWVAPNDEGQPIDSYQLQYKIADNDQFSTAYLGHNLTANVTGLTTNATYDFQVRAHNGMGYSLYSPSVNFATYGVCGDQGDLLALQELGTYNDKYSDCSFKCLAKTTCVASCIISDFPNMTQSCTLCYGDFAACAKSNCESICAVNSNSEKCQECSASNCLGALVSCAGIPCLSQAILQDYCPQGA
eukprot:TRINITY_DN142_c0_g2_i1.p1 TRINITY_DN142_c0_g2~~TRINITY_DN142_c0_g2_i1.p1  ORF type:complete len:758 (+),score=196.09 TRINITY_DN142_c0_g2_i1:179-2452(+)